MPGEPKEIVRTCTPEELTDLEFRVACTGYRVVDRIQTATGWEIRVVPCTCPVCSAWRADRANPKAPHKTTEAPVSLPRGKAFFAALRKELEKS